MKSLERPASEGEHPSRVSTPASSSSYSLKTRTIALTSVGFVAGALTGIFLFLTASELGYGDWARPYEPVNQNKLTHGVHFELDFPAIFPDISSPRRSKCRTEWESLASISCHEMVFSRITDNSSARALRHWDSRYYVPKICQNDCFDSINEAYNKLSAACSEETDRFILEGYPGVLAPEMLEPGPVDAVRTLLQRWKHTCRASPIGDSDFEFCPIEMQQLYGIVDSINVNLEGINTLIRLSTWRRVNPAKHEKGTTYGAGYNYTYDYTVREQRFGPGRGDMSCTWCLLDYLNHTLNSWVDGAIFAPGMTEPLGLPELIQHVGIAGLRCDSTETWDKIYKEAIARYFAAGLLPVHWADDQPSSDLKPLVMNGPSHMDYPLADVKAELETLYWTITQFGYGPHSEKIAMSINCFNELAELYTSTKCYNSLSRDVLYSMLQEDMGHIRSEFCSERCNSDTNSWPAPNCRRDEAIPRVSQHLDQYQRDRYDREHYCGFLGPEPRGSHCARALTSTNRTEWIFDGQPFTIAFINGMNKDLDDVEAKIAALESCSVSDDQNPLVATCSEENRQQKQKEIVASSICAVCIWNWMTDSQILSNLESLRSMQHGSDHQGYVDGYAEFLKQYHSRCSSLGADWFGGVPYGDDPRIWRVKEKDGRIMRYIQPATNVIKYGVDEATGEVQTWDQWRPGYGWAGGSPGDLWHVLEFERGSKAGEEGRYWEWKKEEEEFRKEVDKEIWKAENEWGLMSYIGPKNGLQNQEENEPGRLKDGERDNDEL